MNHERSIDRQRQRRKYRVRKRMRGTSERPRLSVCRSHKHIYAQLIDDSAGKTLLAASTLDNDLQGKVTYGGNKSAAEAVGEAIAQRAVSAGVTQISFDRGRYNYHGRVAALADAARKGGLKF